MTINQFRPDYAIPPGEILKEYLTCFKLSDDDKKLIKNIIDRNIIIDQYIAAKLQTFFYLPASYWLQIEANYQSDLERLNKMDLINKGPSIK